MILERDSRGWWKVPTKATLGDEHARYLVPEITYIVSCTHTMGETGRTCPWCGGIVP